MKGCTVPLDAEKCEAQVPFLTVPYHTVPVDRPIKEIYYLRTYHTIRYNNFRSKSSTGGWIVKIGDTKSSYVQYGRSQ